MSDEPAAATGENPFQSPHSSQGDAPPPKSPSPGVAYLLTLLAVVGAFNPFPGPYFLSIILAGLLASCSIPGFILCSIAYRRQPSVLTGAALALCMLVGMGLFFAILSSIAVYQASRNGQPL